MVATSQRWATHFFLCSEKEETCHFGPDGETLWPYLASVLVGEMYCMVFWRCRQHGSDEG